MREIKFRAWEKKNKFMVKVDSIDLNSDGGFKVMHIGKGEVITIFEPDFELMQFTGLKDKNGKEIYEGDIIVSIFPEEHPMATKGEVVYWPGSFKIFNEETGDNWDLWEDIDVHIMQVMGNIYENPELLK